MLTKTIKLQTLFIQNIISES